MRLAPLSGTPLILPQTRGRHLPGGPDFVRRKAVSPDKVSDSDKVYLLYSGKPFDNADSPNYECNHLIVYDWDGIPKRHIVLGESVMSIAVDGDALYGLSSWPDSRILIYDLS